MNWRRSFYWTLRNSLRSVAVAAGIWKQRRSLAVLAIGQSNMEGNYGPPPARLRKPDRREQVWNFWSHSFTPSRLGQRPFWMTPDGPANCPAFVFCRHLSRRRNVFSNLVLLTSVGKKLEFFLPESVLDHRGWTNGQTCSRHGETLATALFSLSGHARQALRALNRSAYDIILIHQGEGNFTNGMMDDEETYFRKISAFLEELTRNGLRDRSTLVVLGKISSAYVGSDAHARALDRLKAETVAIVEWSGIPAVGGRDLHASPAGLTMLGERYFDQYMALERARMTAGVNALESVSASAPAMAP